MNFQLVNQKLTEIGWDWGNPRIVAYVEDLSTISNINYSPSLLPEKHYHKLFKLISIYQRINQTLVACQVGWDDPTINEYFHKYSVRDKNGNPLNRLKLDRWVELERLVVDVICPF